jgi:hypothetical protein
MADLSRAFVAAIERSEPGLRARRLRLSLELSPRGCTLAARQSLVELLARRLVRHLLASAPAGATVRLALQEDLGRRWIELAPSGAGPDLQIALAAADRLGAHVTTGAPGTVLRIDLPQEA